MSAAKNSSFPVARMKIDELLRHIDDIGAYADPIVDALVCELRTWSEESVPVEESVPLEEAERRERKAQERGWQDGLAIARELLSIELDASQKTDAQGQTLIDLNDPTTAALDRLDYELEKAANFESDEYVGPESLRTPPPARSKLRVREKKLRPKATDVASPRAEVTSQDASKSVAPQASGGKHQRTVRDFLLKAGGAATREDVRSHLLKSGVKSKSGAYGVLSRMVQAGVLDEHGGDRVNLAASPPTD